MKLGCFLTLEMKSGLDQTSRKKSLSSFLTSGMYKTEIGLEYLNYMKIILLSYSGKVMVLTEKMIKCKFCDNNIIYKILFLINKTFFVDLR